MNWMRLYAEFATDPKVQMMDEALQRRFIMLLCMRCRNGDETFHETFSDAQIAFEMRISMDEVKRTKTAFETNSFIDGNWNLLNWNKRQYVSDVSTMRVRKHREKVKRFTKQHETVSRNGKVTPPDTDTDTETEAERAKAKATGHRADDQRLRSDFDTKLWPACPRKVGKVAAFKAFVKLKPDAETVSKMVSALGVQARWPQWSKNNGEFIPHPATWINGHGWEDEAPTTSHNGAGRDPGDPASYADGVVL